MWIDVRRREQRVCSPPEKEQPKIIPAGTKAEVRKVGDDEWTTHYLRHDFDVTDRTTDIHGFYHAETDGYQMRVHRTEIRKGTVPDPMIPLKGKTFPVRHTIKRLGGRWDARAKTWRVPARNAAAAEELVHA